MDMEKVLLDTDIGGDIDDAVCLAYLLREPRCELMGITTVCGEPGIRASIADAICKAAGKAIPIAAGLDSTMSPARGYPTPGGAQALMHWKHDRYEKTDAPAFLYQKIREHPGEITLIGIGNMTNIATLLTRYQDAAGLLKGLCVMNGYFGEKPLPSPNHNWNTWVDPLAAQITFSSRVANHRVIPLEVTETLGLDAEQARQMLAPNSALLRAVYAFGDNWLQEGQRLTLHDPLAAMAVFYPDLCCFERGNVSVVLDDQINRGATSFLPQAGGCLEVARSVERDRFYRLLRRTLCDQ